MQNRGQYLTDTGPLSYPSPYPKAAPDIHVPGNAGLSAP